MSGLRLVQVAVRAVTGLVLHLDGGVANLIVMFEKVLDALKQAIMVMGRDHWTCNVMTGFSPTSQT